MKNIYLGGGAEGYIKGIWNLTYEHFSWLLKSGAALDQKIILLYSFFWWVFHEILKSYNENVSIDLLCNFCRKLLVAASKVLQYMI